MPRTRTERPAAPKRPARPRRSVRTKPAVVSEGSGQNKRSAASVRAPVRRPAKDSALHPHSATLPAPHPDLPIDQLLGGDCVAHMADLPAESVALIFADPPYNLSGKPLQWEGKAMGGSWYKVNEAWDTMSVEDYRTFTEAWLAACYRLLMPGGALYVCCTLHNLSVLMHTLESLGLRCNNVITWYKPNAMPSMTRRNFTHSTELILYFVKGSGWIFNYHDLKALNPERRQDGETRQMRDFWSIALCQGKERLRGADKRALHPTQKPEALVERAIVASSLPGQVILDPFLGSGTTAVVARRLKRHYIGIEQNPAYLEAARERLTQKSGSRSTSETPSSEPGT